MLLGFLGAKAMSEYKEMSGEKISERKKMKLMVVRAWHY